MRRFCFTILITTFFLNTKAQITKNNWLVGGNFAFTKSESKGEDIGRTKNNSLEMAFNLGYFFHDKWVSGIGLNIFSAKSKIPQVDGSVNKTRQTNFGIGPFIRYYFLDVDNRVNIFSDARALFSFISNNSVPDVSKEWTSSLSAGTVIFFNSSVGLEFLLGYTRYDAFEIDAKANSLQFKIGLQIHLEKE